MRILNFLVLIVILTTIAGCQIKESNEWIPAPNPLMTSWAADIDPAMPWPEYPRPQMSRNEWVNLNGLWDYTLLPEGEEPEGYSEKILVPYPVESSLSGIADSVGPGHVIWYRRTFEIPSDWTEKNILLNFEAVDWETTVYVNGEAVGSHRGGYDPFTFDITEFISIDGSNELIVKVKDPTNEGYQPRGKQVLKPGGIWYTPTSGIWQTVWLEPVPETYIKQISITPKPSSDKVSIELECINLQEGDDFEIFIKDEGNDLIGSYFGPAMRIEIELENYKLWSPDQPQLYDVEINIMRKGKPVDQLISYFGMRSIESKLADDGFVRLFLNNEILFHNGTLDQGFWPDGLYTPPTDEAMRYDIELTKELGFNMLRKHVKIENRRFYYWCDKLGIMVWQDMPSTSGYVAPDKPDLERPQKEVDQFRFELQRMIETKINHPSIVMWVPFNEGWGQFDTEEIVNFIYELDPDRLVNNTSGWADRGVGDVIDIHHYPDPRYPEPENDRASVLGEFGGLGLYIEGHTWEQKNWGYRKMNDSLSLLKKYEQFYTLVWEFMEKNGLAAAVYTQTSDVETETNGLISYDRKRIKMDQSVLMGINTNNYVPSPRFDDEEEEGLFSKSHDVIISGSIGEVYYTLDGSVPTIQSNMYEAPIRISGNTIVKAVSINGDKKSLMAEKEYTLSRIEPPVYLKPYDERYTGGGFFALVDGKTGGNSFSDGKWQGYRDNGMDVVIDLGSTKKLSRVSANFLTHHEGWIFLPATFTLYTSDNKKDFVLVSELTNEVPEQMSEPGIKQLSFDGLDIETRYIRLTAETIGPVPAWHTTAKSRPAWFFIDEVIAE